MDPASNDQSLNQADSTQQPIPPVDDPTNDPTQPITPPQEPITDDSAGLPAPVPGSTTSPDQPIVGGLPGVENAPVVDPAAEQPAPEVSEVPAETPVDSSSADQNQQFGSF